MSLKPHRIPFSVTLLLILAVVLLLAIANLLIGSVDIPPAEILRIIAGKGCENQAWESIILQSRLPMIATALLSGAACRCRDFYYKRHSTTRSRDRRFLAYPPAPVLALLW